MLLQDAVINDILTPFAQEQGAGLYLKSHSDIYRPLRNAFNIAQSSLRKLTMNPAEHELDELRSENIANWQRLESLLIDCLTHHSKDLECLSWLALCQLFTPRPFYQLGRCLQLIDQILENFWPDVHPHAPAAKLRGQTELERDTAQLRLKVKPLVQLFGENDESGLLRAPLKMLPLVGDINTTAYLQFERKNDQESLKEQVVQALQTEKTETQARYEAIKNALAHIEQLDETLNDLLSHQRVVVSTRFIKMQLQECLCALTNMTEGLLERPEEPVVNHNQNDHTESVVAAAEPAPGPAVQVSTAPSPLDLSDPEKACLNRDEVFRQLRQIADYFAATEPQSPVSYLLEKAIRWGYMPLPELMAELLQNDSVMGRVSELAGFSSDDKVNIPAPQPEQTVQPKKNNSPLSINNFFDLVTQSR